MTHWAIRYIGDEWVTREHDCWGFVRRVYREQFGIAVPAVDVDSLNLARVLTLSRAMKSTQIGSVSTSLKTAAPC